MSEADLIQVAVSLAGSVSPTVQNFGTPMFCAYFPPTYWEDSGDLIRFYPTSSALTQLIADGFAVTHPVYRAFEVACGQSTAPTQIALGRRQTANVQVLKLTALSTTAGQVYAVTLVGSDGIQTAYTMLSTGVPATDAASLAALFTAANIGTVTVSSATITFTQSSGLLTDFVLWSPTFKVQDATASSAGTHLTADLAAISAVNTIDWYSVSLDSNSAYEVEAAAAFVEATGQGGKVGFFNNADTINVTAGGGDLNSTLQSESYVKSYLQQSDSQVLSWAGFAMASLILSMYPGSYALSYKSLAGVLTDTDATLTETQQLVLNTASTANPGTGGKNGNWYKTVAGLNLTFPGVTPGGRWMDTTIFIDWLQATSQAALLAYFAGLPKVPMTDIGIQGAVGVLKSQFKIGGSAPYGGLDLTQPYSVTAPLVSQLSTADRNNRNLSGLSARAFLSGAINTTEVQIVVSN